MYHIILNESSQALSNSLTWVDRLSEDVKIFVRGKGHSAESFKDKIINCGFKTKLKVINVHPYFKNKRFSIEDFVYILSSNEVIYQFEKNNKKYSVNLESDRYKNFMTNGFSCKYCGFQGTHFWAESNVLNDSKLHFNLYGLTKNNNEMMLTKDHIIPKSAGGLDVVENFQVLCEHCNSSKGSMIPLDKHLSNNYINNN